MADQRLPDEEIQLRRKARQRLIGAVTLMMAAVVVLPWALDGKPRTHANEIAVYLPASAAPGNSHPVPPGTPVVTAPAVADRAAPAPAAPAAQASESPAASVPAAAPPLVAAAPVAPVTPVKPAVMPVKASVDVAMPSEAPAPAHPAVKPAAHPAKTVRSQPSDDEAPQMAVADRPARQTVAHGYVLQLGTFSQADNARQLQARLAAKGVPAFTEHLASPGGDRIRVRVGPYASRAAAENALGQVNALGLSGMVLNVQ